MRIVESVTEDQKSRRPVNLTVRSFPMRVKRLLVPATVFVESGGNDQPLALNRERTPNGLVTLTKPVEATMGLQNQRMVAELPYRNGV